MLDSKLPALFLLDMGSWEFFDKLYKINVETLSDFLANGTENLNAYTTDYG